MKKFYTNTAALLLATLCSNTASAEFAFDSIQYGTTDVPTIEEAARWREDKERSGANNLPSPRAIVEGIRRRGGTERNHEPQEWVIGPELEAAVDALNDQIAEPFLQDVRNFIFGT